MTKTEQTRLTHWRFKVIQRAVELRCVARTCRHFGLSRQTFYKWRRRFAENGLAGLCDRPRAPHRSPRATPAEVVAKILYLRENYHFGAAGSPTICSDSISSRSPHHRCIGFSSASA